MVLSLGCNCSIMTRDVLDIR